MSDAEGKIVRLLASQLIFQMQTFATFNHIIRSNFAKEVFRGMALYRVELAPLLSVFLTPFNLNAFIGYLILIESQFAGEAALIWHYNSVIRITSEEIRAESLEEIAYWNSHVLQRNENQTLSIVSEYRLED